ncbi:MAG: hypothetical protein ACRCSB_06350 [Bacteroidales bacterium]
MQNNSHTKYAAIITILFHGVLIGLLFILGFQKPFPLPPEEGIQINFGTDQDGKGDVFLQISANQSLATPIPTDKDEPYLTQEFEEAPSVNLRKKRKKKKKQQSNTNSSLQTDVPQREVNKAALYKNTATHTQGNTVAEGSQGTRQGSLESKGRGLGRENSGVSLSGRTLIGQLPEPEYNIQQSGKVIVRIKVNREGRVVEAKAQQTGSTLIDATLYAAAEQAAMRAKFSTSDNVSLHQIGTILYVFKLGK